MKAEAVSLFKTFTHDINMVFKIPEFQRPYIWSIENCEELWEDLIEAYEQYNDKDKNAFQNYFLGPIVIVKQNDSEAFIVDGQQRLTTFTILFWHVLPILKENSEERTILLQMITTLNKLEKPRLIVSQNQNLFLRVKEGKLIEDSKEPFAIAANYFYKKIREFDKEKPNLIYDFLKFIREKTEFILVTTENFETAWDLFIGLNSKGEALNPADLIKAFVCGKKLEEGNSIWNEKVAILKDYATSYLLFLTRYKLHEFIIEKNLYKKFTENFDKPITLTDISRYAHAYNLIWNTEVNQIYNQITEDFQIKDEAIKSLLNLRELDRRDVTPIIFMYMDKFDLKSIFDVDFLNILESFEVKMAISRRKSHERKITVELSKLDISTKKEEALKQISQMLKDFIIDDNTIHSFVKVLDYYSSIGRLILKSMELMGNKILKDLSSKINIEHLMPRKYTSYWWKASNCQTENEYNGLVNNIGNLFIIDSTTNNKIKNADFETKKEYYRSELSNCSIFTYTKDLTEWTSDSIKNRANEIADFVIKNWSLT